MTEPLVIEKILATPAVMTPQEKLLLYSLVLGLQPKSVLEIGVFEGGSSQIILQALDWNGGGELYSIDPNPQVTSSWFDPNSSHPHDALGKHWHLVIGSSPLAIGRTVNELANVQPFDFVLIDGDHSKAGVIADAEGVIPYLADDAHLLFHDAYAPGVEDALEYILEGIHYFNEPYWFIDCGILCKTPVYLEHMGANYYGMRLVRFERG